MLTAGAGGEALGLAVGGFATGGFTTGGVTWLVLA
ncbi:MAG: hypothetical protein QOI41_3239, partial [Myxococcales bacterium]|nr:hypothetical protein [Myxococcales bacterium]